MPKLPWVTLTKRSCHTIGRTSSGTPDHARPLSSPMSMASARSARANRSLRRAVRTERCRETPAPEAAPTAGDARPEPGPTCAGDAGADAGVGGARPARSWNGSGVSEVVLAYVVWMSDGGGRASSSVSRVGRHRGMRATVDNQTTHLARCPRHLGGVPLIQRRRELE